MKKSNLLFTAAAIGGALISYCQHRKENQNISDDDSVENCEIASRNLVPISSLLSKQQNLELISRKALRTWFLKVTDSQIVDKKMLIAVMRKDVMDMLGYEIDISLDTDNYLLLEIWDEKSQKPVEASLVNFIEIESSLKTLLDKGNGIIRVKGETKAEAEENADGNF